MFIKRKKIISIAIALLLVSATSFSVFAATNCVECGSQRYMYCNGQKYTETVSHKYGFLWLNTCTYNRRIDETSLICTLGHKTIAGIDHISYQQGHVCSSSKNYNIQCYYGMKLPDSMQL